MSMPLISLTPNGSDAITVCVAGSTIVMIPRRLLLKIPFGKTVCYSEIAKAIGRPRAVRAVANAIGANAISIIAPCHRVVLLSMICRRGAVAGAPAACMLKVFIGVVKYGK